MAVLPRGSGEERAGRQLTSLTQMKDLRMNVARACSGSPGIMRRLLEANNLDPAQLKISRLDQTAAIVAS